LQHCGCLTFSGNAETIGIGYLYHPVQRATQSLATSLACPPTSHGKRLINGQKYTVNSAVITNPHQIFPHVESIGDMIFFEILGQPFLILGSVEKTYDLFEKRSQNYSDRPRFPMLNEVLVASFSMPCLTCLLESRMDYRWNMALLRYGLQWRSYRRTFHYYFHPNIIHKYYSVQVTRARAFLRHLLKSPDRLKFHIRQ